MTEDELSLWRRCRSGDEVAREKLILMCLPLVDMHVRRIGRVARWANLDDLRQEGVKGLIWAVDRFDPNAGRIFEAYAYQPIRGAILRNPELARNLKRHHYDNYRKTEQAQNILMHRLLRKPTMDEVAQEAGLTIEEVENSIIAMHLASADSDGFADPANPPELADERAEDPYIIMLVKEALPRLCEDEQRILVDSYWNGRTDPEIATICGGTAESIKKKRQRALEKMRRLLEPERGEPHETGRSWRFSEERKIPPLERGRASFVS